MEGSDSNAQNGVGSVGSVEESTAIFIGVVDNAGNYTEEK